MLVWGRRGAVCKTVGVECEEWLGYHVSQAVYCCHCCNCCRRLGCGSSGG